VFAGKRREGDVTEAFMKLGFTVVAFDLEISKDHDLSDDLTWKAIVKYIEEGRYAACLAAPPVLRSLLLGGSPSEVPAPLKSMGLLASRSTNKRR